MRRAEDVSPVARDLRRKAFVAFGLELPVAKAEALARFAALLGEWSARMNLVSTRSLDETIDLHVLDSLAAAALLGEGETFADVGSGGGLPGIPLAIAASLSGWLIESRERRVSFLRKALRELGIQGIEVFSGRAEAFEGPPVHVAVTRAVSEDVIAGFARAGLHSEGRLMLMRKASQPEPGIAGFELEERREYRLPGGEQHALVVLRRRST